MFFGQDLESLNKLSKFAITVNNEDNEYRLDVAKGYSNNLEDFGTEGFKKLTAKDMNYVKQFLILIERLFI